MPRYFYDDRRWVEGYSKKYESERGSILTDIQWSLIRDVIGKIKGKRILDLGAGTGRFSRMLAELGAEVTAVDKSEAMLRYLRAHTKRIRILQGNAYELDLADSSFDYVLSVNVFNHLEKYETALKECRRVLSDNGGILIGLPNRDSLLIPAMIAGRILRFFDGRRPFSRYFSPDELVSALKKAGFKDIGYSTNMVLDPTFTPLSVSKMTLDLNKKTGNFGCFLLVHGKK